MEVPSRTADPSRQLSGTAAWAWSRRWAALALVVGLGAAVFVVSAQPTRSPWWTYADADASYTATALNLVAGHRALFVDHPGLPVTEAAWLVLTADTALRGDLSPSARDRYVDERLLDLDRTRWAFRGLAIAAYLAGALLAFVLLTRFFGHWSWGLAGSLLWLAAPGLQPMSIQLRPDVPLALCSVAFAYLIGRAVELRDSRLYCGAAAVAGLALTIKLHAIGLVAPLALALVWRPPSREWRPAARTVAWVTATVFVVSIVLNLERIPFTPTWAQVAALAVALGATAVVAVLARTRRAAAVVLSYAAGVLVPVALVAQDGLQALVVLGKSAVGKGVSDVPSFSTPLDHLESLVGTGPLVLLGLALVAGILGLRRGDPRPVVWATGALAMGVLAWARPVNAHYLAPSFVLAVPAALWAVQRGRRAAAPLLLWPVVLWIAWPALRDRDGPAEVTERLALEARPLRDAAVASLGPGEVALAPSYWPDGDVRYFELVQLYADHTPPYPYRLLPDTDAARRYAREHGLRVVAEIE